jgi:CHAT domain-containing protein
MIHFATHGALAGQVSGNSGLLLTPPDTATESDDGYLSASEVAALKLDADWVILSACNTAAGGVEGAEALSGLARAFFYAGARALLVSHWAVDSDAAVKLITRTAGRMAADKGVGRAKALRRSMLALIDKDKINGAPPATGHRLRWWARVVFNNPESRKAMTLPAVVAAPALSPRPARPKKPVKTPDWRTDIMRQ